MLATVVFSVVADLPSALPKHKSLSWKCETNTFVELLEYVLGITRSAKQEIRQYTAVVGFILPALAREGPEENFEEEEVVVEK